MKYNKINLPQPWKIPENLEFVEEPWDNYPKGGFLEDVILYQKGYETTNFLSFWAGVHYVSSVVMRDTWLRWAHGGMYPNFYLLMVAPPGLVKKSTTIHGLEKVESESRKKIENPVIRFDKTGVIIRGKATPEAIFASLSNERIPIEIGKDENGETKYETREKNANLIIRVSELSTLISQAKYNVALIDKLTDFYDCKDTDSDTTIGRGNIELKNVFCTMMGATTPDTLATTIPREAFGGGFISRSLVLKEDYTERIFPEPVAWPELPQTDELAERLAWIGVYKKGEYTLTPDAYDIYARWYTRNKLALREQILNGETEHENNRKDIHILKLAHILSLQNYKLTRIIDEDEILKAIQIIEYTIKLSHDLLKETGTTGRVQEMSTVERALKRKGELTRKQLVTAVHHKGINSEMINSHLNELLELGRIEVYNEQGAKRSKLMKSSTEVYKWVGK